MIWLLDHNLPVQLKPLLTSFGVTCETTRARAWENLQNGELVRSAFEAGFRSILTRDVRFGSEAARALSAFPAMSVVLLRLPQRRSSLYLQAFSKEWSTKPIVPLAGKVITWP